MNILVDLDDEVIEKYELTADECLFLSWFINFYGYGKGKVIVNGDKQYLWITYNKILDDIKTLRCTKRQVARMVSKLCETELIEKYIAGKNKLYLCPNFDRISGNEFEGQKCLPIIKYNKEYIKIIYNKKGIDKLDGNEFLEKLKDRLNGKIGKVTFDCIFHNSNVHLLADKMIIMKVCCAKVVQQCEEIFKQKVQEVVDELLG